jgi:zinc transport system substrate-binding protein
MIKRIAEMKRILYAATLLLIVSCSDGKKDQGAGKTDKINVFVSILPEKYLVDRIGGEYVKTGVMAPKGQDPHDYAPNPGQLMQLGRASVYFEVGMPFEKRIVEKLKGTNCKIKFIDISKGIKRREVSGGEHEHERDGDHGQDGFDPHVWNSLRNLEIMSKNICDELVKLDPSKAKTFTKNLQALDGEITKLNEQLRLKLKPFKNRTFFVFHPAFGYFADEFGMKQKAVEVEGKSPTPKQIAALVKEAKKDKVKIIFVSPQFNAQSAEAIAKSIGGVVVSLDPLPEDPIKNFSDIAGKLKQALSSEKKSETP